LPRQGINIAAVALANKTARIAWAMMTKGTDYQPGLVAVSTEQLVRKKEYQPIAKHADDGDEIALNRRTQSMHYPYD
jgi:hypothetical protein